MTTLLTGPALARLVGDWRTARAGGPAYTRLADAVAALVLDGRVPIGARLPAERELAGHLAVSRATVTAAYDRLRERGYIRSRVGAGSWTALPAGRVRTQSWTPAARVEWTADAVGAPALDLAVAAPSAPADAVMAALDAARDLLAVHLAGHGYAAAGLEPLREAIAERYRARGVPTDAEQVVVTSGASGALGLVVAAMLGPRDGVVVESPTYPAALDALRSAGARLHPVGVTRAGWDLEMLTGALRQGMPRLAYVIPDFHNPTGQVLDDDSRAAVVAAARRSRTTLVVDESLVELAIEPVDTHPMAAHDTDDVVVSIGSLSKPFWGGLRVGWLRAPQRLLPRLLDARAAIDMGSPVLEQLVAAELIRAADEVLPAVRQRARAQRDALTGALAEHLPAWQWSVPAGGLSLWAELDAPMSTALVAAAEPYGLRLAPGPRFGLDGAHERFLRLPFSLPPEVLTAAVETLARVAGSLRGPSRGAPSYLRTTLTVA